MNVTCMFRAKQRQPSELADAASAFDLAPHEPPAPAMRTDPLSVPAPTDPLVPVNRMEDAAPPEAPVARIVPSAPSFNAGLPARYVATEGRIILIAKARGGIGATTLAVNLAMELQAQANLRGTAGGGRVALVDLDVQLGNAGTFLDLMDRGGMLALARLGPEPDAQAMRHAMVRHPSGLNVLAAPATCIPFEAFDARRIASMLDALAESHDVVVVDLPPALIDWLEPLLARAERLLMITDLAVPSLTRAHRLISLMTEDRPKLPVEIVVAHERKPFRPGQTQRDAESALGHPLRHWLPEEAKLARQALDRGEPLVQLAPRCGWSRAVKAMAAEMQTPLKGGAKSAIRKDH